jgi:DNA-binding response OmpR family regulator
VTALGFEGFTLDPAARTLVDAAGQEVSLRRSEFELLLAFTAAAAPSPLTEASTC